MMRTPAVAGQFYPSDPAVLRQTILALTPQIRTEKKKAIAVIAPHAGYIYSGGVAAETFAHITIPDTIILLGPNHHGAGADMAVMSNGLWEMPFGPVTINNQLATALIGNGEVFQEDASAHRGEHSLEVQIPFLQFHNPHVTIVPITISYVTLEQCLRAGELLAQTINEYEGPVLMVVSTDMTHYEPRRSAAAKDRLAMAQIEKMAPQGLFNTVLGNNISMCGIIPTTIALVASRQLGARKAKLVRYTDSGERSHDLDRVVGYAGYHIFYPDTVDFS